MIGETRGSIWLDQECIRPLVEGELECAEDIVPAEKDDDCVHIKDENLAGNTTPEDIEIDWAEPRPAYATRTSNRVCRET